MMKSIQYWYLVEEKIKKKKKKLKIFLNEIQDLISRMLTVDPEQRITIPEIKRHPWMRSNGQMDDEENPLASLGELVFDPDVEKDQEILDTLQVR
jgi:serine/threonine protein kinase